MNKQNKALLIKLGLILILWVMWAIFTYILEDETVVIYLLSVIFLPIIALYYYRIQTNKNIEKLNKVFRFFVWLYIILTSMAIIREFYWGYPYDYDLWSLQEFSYFVLPPIIMLAVLFGLLKVNDNLILNKEKKYCQIAYNFIKQNFGGLLILIGSVILIKNIIGLFIFDYALENIMSLGVVLIVGGILIERKIKK